MATLKTALTLDTADHDREFSKAAEVVGQYSRRMEERNAKSLERAQNELQALRLEASGHREAAEALRSKIAIQDELEKIIRRTGVSQKEALKLAEEKIRLQKQASSAIRDTAEQESRSIANTIRNFKAAAGSVAAFLVIGKGVRIVRGLMKEIDDLGKTATRLRLPTAQVQVLEVAAKRGGTSLEALVTGLNRTQVAATEAARGTATYAREFQQLNIDVESFQRLDPQARLRVLADAYKSAADQGDAFTSLTRIMGRSVSELIPLLQGGAAGVDELKASVRTLDESAVRNVEKLNDAISLLSGNIKTSLLSVVLRLEEPFTQGFTNLAAVVENLLDLADAAGGIGRENSIFAALETLREINKIGGEGAGRTDEKYRTLVARFEEMNETFREQARLMLQNDNAIDLVARGLLSAADAEPIFKGIADAMMELGEEAERAAAAEEQRAWAAQVTAEALEEQAAAAEKMIKDEADLQAKYQERMHSLKSITQKLSEAREEGRKILSDNRAGDLPDLQEKLEAAGTTASSLAILKDIERLFELRDEVNRLTAEAASQAERDEQIKADASASRQRFSEEMEILRARLNGDQDRIDAITRQRRIEEDILQLKREQLDLTDEEARRMATAKADAEDALRAKEQEQQIQRKRTNEGQLDQEMEVLRLRAAGRKEEAAALEKEFKARADAIRIAERTNMTEEQALELVRERQRLEAEIDRQQNQRDTRQRPRSAIFKKDGPGGGINAGAGRGINAGGGRRIGFESRIGLGAKAMEAAKEAKPVDREADVRQAALNYYRENTRQNEELLGIWRTIGVA